MSKCDIYLDINKGNEIYESVRLAFAHKMPCLHMKKLYTINNLLMEIIYLN